MKKYLKLILIGICTIAVLGGCGKKAEQDSSKKTEEMFENAVRIELSDETILVDGVKASSDKENAVYKANDIVYYEEGHDFTYGEGTKEDEHSKEEADKHTVVHITKPGTYAVSGELSYGQIAIDLGEEAKKDETAVVNLILDGVDINCDVAPAVIFYNVYECGRDEAEGASKDVDTSKAGANVYIADDTENNVTGSYVAKIYESYELSEDGTEVVDSKKLHKYDAAFYSKRTMNVNGGTLNILVNGSTGEGDGIDSNGWLVINGGTVIAQACSDSGDAGIDSDMGIHINDGNVIATGNMLDRISESTQTYAVFSFADRQQGENTYVLKNEADEAVFAFENTNAFTYLILAGDKLAEGDYTLWCNDKQCEGSSQGGFGMGRPGENGGRGEGADFEGGAGFEDGTGFGGGKMERPEEEVIFEGMEKPDKGEMPENMEIPENGEMPKGMEMGPMFTGGESSTTFTMKKGENQFMNVKVLNS